MESQYNKIAPELKGQKLSDEIKSVYSTLNQSKKRERFDKPLQKMESWYYELLTNQMDDIKKQFNTFYEKGTK